MNDAYKERDFESIRIRMKNFERFERFQQKQKRHKQYDLAQKKEKNFLVYPIIDSQSVLANVVNRLSFALPYKEDICIYIAVSKALTGKNIFELPTPEFQDRYIGRNKNIRLIDEKTAKRHLKDDYILLHDASAIQKLSVLREAYKLSIIDKSYFSYVEADTMRSLYFYTLSMQEKNDFLRISKENFLEMQEKNKDKNKAYCFTSGPTFDKYDEFYFEENSFKVICNSIVKNEAFLSYIGGADLLAFADPVFHFGPSSYAEQFRQDVLSAVEKYDIYLLLPERNMPLMIAHYPQLQKRLIGIPAKYEFNFPSKEEFSIKGSDNILTYYMLPVASSISNEIGIIGADGRKENEKYFWKHSSSAQYDDKMEGVFNTHPSFFRDRDYEDYYNSHCDFLEKLLEYGESKGKQYFASTPSYIPALKKRYVHQVPSNIGKRSSEILYDIHSD